MSCFIIWKTKKKILVYFQVMDKFIKVKQEQVLHFKWA